MPRKIEVKAYEFKELEAKAKEKAREWARDLQNESGDSSANVSEDFKNTLEELGLSALKAWWSLGYCQGDGVAFEGTVDIEQFINRQLGVRQTAAHPQRAKRYGNFLISTAFVDDVRALLAQGTDIRVRVEHHGHYTHRNSMDVTLDIYSMGDNEDPGATERQDAKALELQQEFHKFLNNLSSQLEVDGYASIEGDLSDEAIDDMIGANGWLFTKNGKRSFYLSSIED